MKRFRITAMASTLYNTTEDLSFRMPLEICLTADNRKRYGITSAKRNKVVETDASENGLLRSNAG